ncbi:MAG: GUN4 domain-containing protein [Brasilonema octagenarum HA4186-MV1]|jgi:serine/threonine protein kinase|nr:GUN4 domain-containing protein [Brasilonema octagenarum HA4186-MV1]
MKIWTPNQSLQNGRFIIQKVLGEGGYGITYSILEQRTGKLFVLKTLHPLQQIKEDFEERQVKFVQEMTRLARCTHPHIVKFEDVINEDGLWGMLMEYIGGVNFNTYVKKRGQLSEDEALLYINQIGQALECVHQQGFLHRDIKPHNILLRRGKQEAVLIDFGLARQFSTGEKSISMTSDGTEGYAPIEQYRRKGTFGAYTDVYGLAATLYFLLTADALKAADEEIVSALRRKYEDEQLPPPKQFNPRISDRVNEAILKGMALEPQDRVQTVREWLELVLPKKINPPIPQPSIPNPQPKIQNQPSQNIATPPKSDDEIKLITAKMNYTQLRDLLAAGNWKQADEETARVMLAVAGREKQGWLDVKHIDNFPCLDLRTIDQLWVKYSNGRFGFSVQKRIYQSLGGTKQHDEKIWKAFSDRVGWRKRGWWVYYNEITFDLKAPQGHLPAGVWCGCSGGVSSLASRLVKCNI